MSDAVIQIETPHHSSISVTDPDGNLIELDVDRLD
jgi:hypothetical protein